MFSGKLRFDIKDREFQKSLRGTLKNVGVGSEEGVRKTVHEISEETLKQVPRQYGTLAKSYQFKIRASSAIILAELGYGRNGDPVDKRTGKRASEYMIPVHEDLEAVHEVGKAKYLEDPWRKYAPKFRQNIADSVNKYL